MNASPTQSAKHYRLAQHYLSRLREASRAYKSSDENARYGLKLAQQEWPQIQQWQAWSAAQAAHTRDAASLCSAYAVEARDLLDVILAPEEQRQWCESGLAAARRGGDQRAELAQLLALSRVYERLAQSETASAYARQALALAERFGDQNSMGKALLQIGNHIFWEGNYAQAREYLEQSRVLLEQVRNNRDLATVLYYLGDLANSMNDPEANRSYLAQALRVYRELSDDLNTARTLFELQTRFNDEQAKLSWAQLDVEERLRLSQHSGDRLNTAEWLMLLARNASFNQNFTKAEGYFQEALELYQQLGMPEKIAHNSMLLGIVSILQARYAEGCDYLLEVLTVARQHHLVRFITENLLLLAFAYWGLGDAENVRAVLREGLPLAREGASEFVSLGMTGVVALRLLTGQPEAAALLAGLVDAYPGTYTNARLFALGMLRPHIEAALVSQTFTAALERGKTLDFEATIAEIVAELEQ